MLRNFYSLYVLLIGASTKSQARRQNYSPSANCVAIWKGHYILHAITFLFSPFYIVIHIIVKENNSQCSSFFEQMQFILYEMDRYFGLLGFFIKFLKATISIL